MGAFTHPITLIASTGQREALVDTGAMFNVIQAPVLERLGVKPSRIARFANGRNGQPQKWQMADVEIEIEGQRMPNICLFGPAEAQPVIGSHTLDTFLLAVDPVEQKLVPKEALLMEIRGW